MIIFYLVFILGPVTFLEYVIYSWPLNYTGLNCMGPLTCRLSLVVKPHDPRLVESAGVRHWMTRGILYRGQTVNYTQFQLGEGQHPSLCVVQRSAVLKVSFCLFQEVNLNVHLRSTYSVKNIEELPYKLGLNF